MSGKNDFYQHLHGARPDYSGALYHVSSLIDTKVFDRWLRSHTGQPVRILDVGCGKGFFLRDFSDELSCHQQMIGRAVGIDLIKSSGNIFSQFPDKFEFVEGSVDGEPLPFDHDTFDIISCNHILEHIFETEKLLREVRRVATPNGLIIISVPNIAAWINRILFLFGSQPLGSEVGTEGVSYGFWPSIGQKHLARFAPAGHVRDFTPRALEDICRVCGLNVLAWWNQSQMPFFPLTKWAGRNMGIVLTRSA